ncbi:flagellar biosynthetic protein FliR [Salsuginibacillus halophilus]|uniref:Flagellar biosynthetic protein FliR n=1 Tax=Salsuginibacillus halophilus TaxID=517424 RepID=A0A2P8HYF1_9BACI|nr:flagellar biosynthetic protein FliR [Salsuginibacillus halophilus]PSL51205.1 flagellar biosynthetic protein FliR [Salsuginibacillus halophilus]
MDLEWLNYLPAWFLIFFRVLAFFMTLPLFSYGTIPNMVKIGLGAYMAWVMFFIVDPEPVPFDAMYPLFVMKEVMLGLFVGIAANMIVSAVQTAGAFIDYKMGFLVANVIDPQTGAQTPLTGGFLNAFAVLLLFAIDGHHLMIEGIFYSYEYVPLDQMFLPFSDGGITYFVVETFSTVFYIAFQIAFPIVGILFLVDVALGMMSRAVPQMNVFVVGLPVKIFLGLPIMMLMMPGFLETISELAVRIGETMVSLLQLFGGA